MQRQSNNGWAACIRASLHGQLDHDRGISCAIASNFDADDADADNDADNDADDDNDADNDDNITQSIDSLKVHPEDYRGDNGIFGLSL